MSFSTSVCLWGGHISIVYQVLLDPCCKGYCLLLLLQVFPSSAIGNLFSRCSFCVVSSHYISSYCKQYYSTCASLCSRASSITTSVTMAPTSVGLAASDWHDVVLPPQLIPRDTMRGPVGHATVPQQWQPQSQMPSQANASYSIGPPQVSFLFQRWDFHQFIMLYVSACYGVYFVLSGSYMAAMLTNGCITIGVYNATTLWSMPLAGICTHTRSVLSGCSFNCFV